MTDTIFALSSGRPPAAIAVMRISGPRADAALGTLAGSLPAPRTASLRALRDQAGDLLDRALVIRFPGPATATGEDLVELHLHGGRAIVASVEQELSRLPGLRLAQPGEFTRRALQHGRLDVIQAEGLADLLEAETESQRRVAIAASEGRVSQTAREWLGRAADIAARVEAELDFGDEDDVASHAGYHPASDAGALACDIEYALAQPSVERLRDGITVVLAGPRNAGKSSLFNALLQRDAAIVTPIAGTTRDVLEAVVSRAGIPYRLVDTAGLIGDTTDEVERIGISRARDLIDRADLVLWLGVPDDAPSNALKVASQCDHRRPTDEHDIATSVHVPETVDALWTAIDQRCRSYVGGSDGMAFRERQREDMASAGRELRCAANEDDPLLQAEHLRLATRWLARLLGIDAAEEMLDALFRRFCLGK
ncbi:tRNA uridine-5-carboxymethylaminomethyl(34) synthesis GTPase MnmE [Sphingomonas adhaesiva]|uniref:tRNA uridine-5-carboxymethylaminomethyl(34) synthesis GTPase MnmE n=1 Tax=Sphingomonas adhaesiva TaxID=28212 RepID=UPI002FF8ECEB